MCLRDVFLKNELAGLFKHHLLRHCLKPAGWPLVFSSSGNSGLLLLCVCVWGGGVLDRGNTGKSMKCRQHIPQWKGLGGGSMG